MHKDIPSLRLNNQQLTSQQFENPEDVIRWFGAVQSQDFAAAKWAIAQRSKNQTDASIDQAFNEGKILRTHVMRPTWHFVSPSDIRWLLELTAPRVHRFNGYYYRRSGFDKTIFEKSNAVIQKALQRDKQLTRTELRENLNSAHIPTQAVGLSYALMQAELDRIIISGPRRGKQFTYMLFDERVPEIPKKTYDEALAELTKRYFQSHGPAQLQDFVWWSGLTITDAKKGIALLDSTITKEESNRKQYWLVPPSQVKKIAHDGFLVPGFDEYFIAYSDRSDVLDKKYAKELNQGGGMVNGSVVIDGKMAGGWKRSLQKNVVTITVRLFKRISKQQEESIKQQAKQFGKFLNMQVVINYEQTR